MVINAELVSNWVLARCVISSILKRAMWQWVVEFVSVLVV